MIAPYVDNLRREILAECKSREEKLGKGQADSFERYKELCGEIAGLKQALEIIINVSKRHGDIDYEHDD